MLKRNRIMKILGMGSLCLFLLGCTKESFLIQKEDSSTMVLKEDIVWEDEEVLEEAAVLKEEKSLKEDNTLTEKAVEEEPELIAVHICGAVNQPGVYYLEKKQRIYDGILKAGGFREDADTEYLNQALFLEDGMKITVPTREETEELRTRESKSAVDGFIEESGSSGNLGTNQQKIDLNTADEELLCTLPGIGESRAKSIIAYRRENGAFKSAEDVMNVSGIKEAAYEKIKDYVTVSQ